MELEETGGGGGKEQVAKENPLHSTLCIQETLELCKLTIQHSEDTAENNKMHLNTSRLDSNKYTSAAPGIVIDSHCVLF